MLIKQDQHIMMIFICGDTIKYPKDKPPVMIHKEVNFCIL